MKTEQSALSARVRKLLSTRNGILMVAVGAAVLAGLILVIFLQAYRSSLTGEDGSTNVLKARELIEAGSISEAIAAEDMYQIVEIPKSDLEDGAITDPADIRGKVLKTDIYPGEQLTSSDFRSKGNSLSDYASGEDRVVGLPMTSGAGMVGEVEKGDHIDVIALFNVDQTGRQVPMAATIMNNAEVLKAPGEAKQNAASATLTYDMYVKAPDDRAAEMAFAAEYGKLWFTLRPGAGAEEGSEVGGLDPLVMENILLNTPPVTRSQFERATENRTPGSGGSR
jgi:pilus assembly protein CpaB